MVLILAVDTAGEGLSLALGDGRAVWKLARGVRAADAALWPALESLLRRSRRRLPEVSAVACAVGPGRFTAVRVGVTFADLLARSLGVPAVGITRFEAAARGLPEGAWGLVLPSLREESFVQLWRRRRGRAAPAGGPFWVPAGGLDAALAGYRRLDIAPGAAELLEPARERLKSRRRAPLRPLYLKPANYAR